MTRIEFRLSSHYFKELPPNKVVVFYKDQNLEHILGDFASLDQIYGLNNCFYTYRVMFKVGEIKRNKTFRIILYSLHLLVKSYRILRVDVNPCTHN